MQVLSQYVYNHDFTGTYFCALRDFAAGQKHSVQVKGGDVFKCHGMFGGDMLFYADKALIITTPDNRYRVAYKNEERLCKS